MILCSGTDSSLDRANWIGLLLIASVVDFTDIEFVIMLIIWIIVCGVASSLALSSPLVKFNVGVTFHKERLPLFSVADTE